MTPEQKEILENDAANVGITEHVYKHFIRDYIHAQSLSLYQQFVDISPSDVPALLAIKSKQELLNQIEGDLLTRIAIGKDAKRQLDEQETA